MHKVLSRSRPVTTGAVYFLLASATVATTRYGGGVAFIWVATAFLFARLSSMRQRSWASSLIACAIGSVLATTLFGTGAVTALPLAVCNVAEALVGIVLLRRLAPQPRALETLHGTLLFIFCVGLVAPAVTAPFGAAIVAAVTGTGFLTNVVRWYSGHALGAVAFGPLFLMLFRGDLQRSVRSTSPERMVEAAVVLIGVVATTWVVFSQSRLPLLFLPILPVMIALFRFGGVGGAVSVLLVTVIGGACTLNGTGPALIVDATAGDQLLFLQFYIAVMVMIALPVGAELAQRSRLMRRVRDSEARFRMLAEHSTDVILSLSPDGVVRFASNAISRLGGYLPEEVVGRKASAFVMEDDRPIVLGAFRSAFEAPETAERIEYRCRAANGAAVWVEAHVQALIGADGRPDGLVTVLRGTEERRRREQQLARQAVTDPLTGICNRRGFFDEVDAWLRSGPSSPGCFALFDLDHFKRINDRHGHQAGDEVLVHFAELMRATVRENDVIGRLGGEEFGILLRNASREQATAVCERLRVNCSLAGLYARNGVRVTFTASAGVAVLNPGMTREEIYHAADVALYQAKEGGRDRVALAA